MKLHPNVVCGSDPSSYVAEGIFPLVGSPKVFRLWRGNRDSWWLPIVESGFRWRPISCRRSSLDPVYGVDGGQRALVQFWGACLVWGTCQRSTIAWLMTSCIQRWNKLVFGVSSSLDRHLSSRSLETFFYSLHHSSQQLLIHFQGLPVKCYKHFYFFASWTYFSHIRKLLCSWMNVELQQLCNCADIYFHNACFWSGTKPLLPPSRDRLCEMNSAACFAVLSRRVFSLLSLSCPGFSFPSSTLSASANYSHLSSNAPSLLDSLSRLLRQCWKVTAKV